MICCVEKLDPSEKCGRMITTADEMKEGKVAEGTLCFLHMPGSAWWQANRPAVAGGTIGTPMGPGGPMMLGNAPGMAMAAAVAPSPTGYRCSECDAVDNASHHPGCPMAQGARAPGPAPGFHVNGTRLTPTGNTLASVPPEPNSIGALPEGGSGSLSTPEEIIAAMKRLPESEGKRLTAMIMREMLSEMESPSTPAVSLGSPGEMRPAGNPTEPAPMLAGPAAPPIPNAPPGSEVTVSPDGMSRTIITPAPGTTVGDK